MGNTSACTSFCCEEQAERGKDTFVKVKRTSFLVSEAGGPDGDVYSQEEDRAQPSVEEFSELEQADPKVAPVEAAWSPEDRVDRYEDGSTYDGQLLAGERHGHGTWRAAREKYTGQWRRGHRHGEGAQTWHDGRTFQGQFQAGRFHGHGRMEWRTTAQGLTTFEGQYVQDLKHGTGKFSWPDGRVYDGGWRDGKRHGEATVTNTQGTARRGICEDDAVVRWLPDGEGAPSS